MFARHLARMDAMRDQMMMPDFPERAEWFNSFPMSFKGDLKGKIVILVFCHFDSLSIFQNIKMLHQKYFEEPIMIIGIYSPQTEKEKDADHLREAILNNRIDFPIVNDSHLYLFKKIGVRSLPTFLVVGPYGNILLSLFGEKKVEQLDEFIPFAIKHYSEKKT